MATDAALLLRGLRDYQVSLDQHRVTLRELYHHLDARWHALSGAYDGDAAREFHGHWLRTKYNFEAYIAASERISHLLNERIDALVESENVSGLLD